MNLDMLNKEQREAVLHTEGPLLILAGAGSGKTRVLTHRIAHLIQDKNVYPSNILAITFTNKAAKEMKSRIEALAGEDAQGMWVGTFHSVCVKMLRKDGEKLGYTKDFAIFDPYDQLSLIKEVYKELKLDDKKYPHKMTLSRISEAKNELISPDEYEGVYGSDFQHAQICKCYRLYQKKLRTYNAMDFDDLIGMTIELFRKDEEVLSFYRNKFRYIHVDEYQDTNKAQYLLVSMLAGSRKNLCVVGDNDQSIYAWRGADIRNIKEFGNDFPGALVVKLEQNYRSHQNILKAANSVIRNNTGRNEKNLWSSKDEGDRIRYFCANNEYEEARFIASQIISRKLMDKRKLSDFAILYRTNAQSRVLEDALRRENVNYRLIGGLKFYERKEIKDVLSYFRLISNVRDDISFLRVINAPKRGIGDKSIEKIKEVASEQGISLFEASRSIADSEGFTRGARAGLADFVKLMVELSERASELGICDVFKRIVEDTGYIEMLKKEETREAQSRLENLNELANAVIEFEKRFGKENSIPAFLEENTLKSDIDSLQDDADGVTLMTLHTAKGLEYPVVFMTGLEEKTFPTSRAVDNVLSSEAMEEERRLAYVGITRAEEMLYITHSRTRNMFGSVNYYEPSRFIKEIEKDLLENVGDDDGIFRVTSSRKAAAASAVKTSLDSVIMASRRREQAQPTSGDGGVAASSVGGGDIRTGMKVKHPMFGGGTVISVQGSGDDAVATIAFASKGIKKLKLSFANMVAVQ
jgi:DNA helicase II / ATP-dependent DNA helicase PcrA